MVESGPSQSQYRDNIRNDEITDEENAPLLAQDANEDAPEDHDPASSRTSRVATKRNLPRLPPQKAMRFLTPAALYLSSSSLLLIIVTFILDSIDANHFVLGWRVRDSLRTIIYVTVLSIVLSAFNTIRSRQRPARSQLPNFIALILDFIIAFVALSNGIGGLIEVDSGYCYGYGSDASCMRKWGIPCRVIAGAALGCAVLLGAIHLLSGIVRCILLARSGSEARKRGGGSWSLPTGQFTFEVSVKLFKEPQGMVAPLPPQERHEEVPEASRV